MIFNEQQKKNKGLERSKKIKVNEGSQKNLKSQSTINSNEGHREKLDLNNVNVYDLDNIKSYH